VPVGVTGHRTQRPKGQVGPPGPHPAQPSSSLDPGGERRPIPPLLACMIAQLVSRAQSPGRCALLLAAGAFASGYSGQPLGSAPVLCLLHCVRGKTLTCSAKKPRYRAPPTSSGSSSSINNPFLFKK
jgi:hypothetical protein